MFVNEFILRNEPELLLNTGFLLLGKGRKLFLKDEEKLFFSSQNIKADNLLFFSKAKINNETYTTMIYKKIKTNSYTVIVKENGAEELLGSIKFFFCQNEKSFFLLKKLEIDEQNYFINSATSSIVEHILPVRETNNFSLVQIENITCIKHVIRVGNFVCVRPNYYNVVV